MDLIRYEAAKQALAEYRTVDDVKDFRDKAIAIKAYAKQAKDKALECDAAEARLRSERRLGELIEEMPKAKNQHKKSAGIKDIPAETPTLAEQGIDKNLAKVARTAAEVPEEEFETILSDHRERHSPIRGNLLG